MPDHQLTEIESAAFAARFGLASDFAMAKRILARDPSVKGLQQELRDAPADGVVLVVLERVLRLTRAQVDYRYENPHDAALAAYIWALNEDDARIGAVAAEIVLNARQLWGARRLAAEILERSVTAPSETRTVDLATQFAKVETFVCPTWTATRQTGLMSSIAFSALTAARRFSLHREARSLDSTHWIVQINDDERAPLALVATSAGEQEADWSLG